MLPPLIVVVVLSMIKDGYEDYKRHAKDQSENNSVCHVLSKEPGENGLFKPQPWHSVKVG